MDSLLDHLVSNKTLGIDRHCNLDLKNRILSSNQMSFCLELSIKDDTILNPVIT